MVSTTLWHKHPSRQMRGQGHLHCLSSVLEFFWLNLEQSLLSVAFQLPLPLMGKRPRGGYGQVLARAKRQEEREEPPQSRLASELLNLWSWGTMSAPLVQQLAASALSDGLNLPGLDQLPKLGSSGKHPGNMHRDLMAISGKATALQEFISMFPIRLKAKQQVSEELPLQFLLPHKLFSFIYSKWQPAFLSSILGGETDNLAKFWAAMKTHPNVLRRLDLLHRHDLQKVVPIAIHGDGVAYMRTRGSGTKSLEVLSSSSLLSHSATKETNFLMFLVVKSVVKDSGFCQTWPRVWKILCWSLEALAGGTWPMLNWDGQEFDPSSHDHQFRGSQLAEGYSAIFFSLRSDLDFLSNHFGLNSPESNSPCCLCLADRQKDSIPWTDCRSGARWRDTIWDPAKWLRPILCATLC